MFNWLFYSWSKFSIPWHAGLLPEFHTKSPLKGYKVNVYQNLSQSAVGNSKYLFFGWKCMKCMLQYNIRKYQSFYQNSFIKVKVDWKNSRRFWGVLYCKPVIPLSLNRHLHVDQLDVVRRFNSLCFFHSSITQTRCFTILWHCEWWSWLSKIHFLYLVKTYCYCSRSCSCLSLL